MQDYINQLLADQGVEADMDPEVRAQLAGQLESRVNDFLNRRLIDALSDEAAEQFTILVDDDQVTPGQVQNFITTNVPNRDEIATNALYEFRALYLGDKA